MVLPFFAGAGPQRGAGDYLFLFFGAFVMAVPIAFFLGTALYMVFPAKAVDPDERELPFWRTKRWRRFVQVIAATVFVGLLATALVASLLRG